MNGKKTEQIANITRGENSKDTPDYLMYYTLRLFFDNGGGACYIVSVGDYSDTKPSKDNFSQGLAVIHQEDEPTLLLLTDGVNQSSTDYYTLCQEVLKQCNDLKDRFGIFDILASDGKTPTKEIGSEFRQGIGNNDLKYGAAYYPYLQTALNYHYTDQSVIVTGLTLETKDDSESDNDVIGTFSTDDNGLLVSYTGLASDQPKVKIDKRNRTNITFDLTDNILTLRIRAEGGTPISDILAAWDSQTEKGSFNLTANGTGATPVSQEVTETTLTFPETSSESNNEITLEDLQTDKTELHNAIKATLNAMRVVMPPSGAVAGIYATVDRERGVWKAPANVSIASVIAPTIKVTNADQENLNVDATSGKSINAIRSFTGQGTLIWGARTLAGNDNEWRYIPVRRLFNLIEESVQKATAFAVFESNNAITWLKVKTLISSYLEGLWRQGALAGATVEQAFFVNVGLGQTMTSQDILEGRMIVEIGIAAVRPAEFIILRFSHKLQES